MREYVFEAKVDVKSKRLGFIQKGSKFRVPAADDDEGITAMLAKGLSRGELCAFYGEPA